jgi:hypothetical protein
MTRLKFINNVNTPLTTHYLVVGANLLYTCTHFHADHCSYLVVNDTLLKVYYDLR